MNAGKATVEWLFKEVLKVDDDWSILEQNGFRWWPHEHMQTIDVIGQEKDDIGTTVYYVSVRTELLHSLNLGEKEVEIINAFLMQYASMAGPVYSSNKKQLWLCTLIAIHEDISGWMNPLIGVAAAIQLSEASIISPELANILNCKQAVSGHPQKGIRTKPDEIASVCDSLIIPLGNEPSRWTASEFHETKKMYMNKPPAIISTVGDNIFTVEFPYGDNTSSFCQVMSDQPHPRYGNGLFLLQSFHVRLTEIEGARLALKMNNIYLGRKPVGYGFGSYVYRDNKLNFVSFFPNMLYRKGLLPNIYFSCAQRAREMSIRLTETDWDHDSFNLERSAIWRATQR